MPSHQFHSSRTRLLAGLCVAVTVTACGSTVQTRGAGSVDGLTPGQGGLGPVATDGGLGATVSVAGSAGALTGSNTGQGSGPAGSSAAPALGSAPGSAAIGNGS